MKMWWGKSDKHIKTTCFITKYIYINRIIPLTIYLKMIQKFLQLFVSQISSGMLGEAGGSRGVNL